MPGKQGRGGGGGTLVLRDCFHLAGPCLTRRCLLQDILERQLGDQGQQSNWGPEESEASAGALKEPHLTALGAMWHCDMNGREDKSRFASHRPGV